MSDFETARRLIREFKGNDYRFGFGVLGEAGQMAAGLGKRAALVHGTSAGTVANLGLVKDSLRSAGVEVVAEIPGARPNTPREDLFRITKALAASNPNVIVAMGAGSTIDAVKAAEVLRTLGGGIDGYFGTGKVTEKLAATGKSLTPMLAIQTAASTGAHLTKYSNITDLGTGQKKLIVDNAVVPARALFDFNLAASMSPEFTADGAGDAMSHALEVLYDSMGKPYHGRMMEIARETIGLVVRHLERAMKSPGDLEAREALALAADLGGYSVMVGGTNGGHVTSYSVVDVLSHGRACYVVNPYYTVFFASAIEEPLRMVGGIFAEAGLTRRDVGSLHGRDLGIAVAEAMIALGRRAGMPATLGEVAGFTEGHIERALAAAKDPALRMKLENMPVPLSPETVDLYMRPILEAARTGNLGLIPGGER